MFAARFNHLSSKRIPPSALLRKIFSESSSLHYPLIPLAISTKIAKASRTRYLSSQPETRENVEKLHRQEYELEYEQRHSGIQLHPESISRMVLPGNVVIRETRAGVAKRRYTELCFGYFWNIKDLKRSSEKPIMTNEWLIPEKQAKLFPSLNNVESLSGETLEVPEHFIRKNRSTDVSAQCTLVGVSFRDFGYKLLPSWMDPYNAEFGSNERVEVFRLNISEGWFNKLLLRRVLVNSTRRNTPEDEHDSTLLCFSNDAEIFRDALRMHNVLTGYVFLLDGLGRVRFAGSGPASEEDVAKLIGFTRDLLTSREGNDGKRPRLSPKRR